MSRDSTTDVRARVLPTRTVGMFPSGTSNARMHTDERRLSVSGRLRAFATADRAQLGGREMGPWRNRRQCATYEAYSHVCAFSMLVGVTYVAPRLPHTFERDTEGLRVVRD